MLYYFPYPDVYSRPPTNTGSLRPVVAVTDGARNDRRKTHIVILWTNMADSAMTVM